MQHIRMNIYAVLALMAFAVFAVGSAFGFTPIDPGSLVLDVGWLEGFTGHMDGSMLADAGVVAGAAAGAAQKRSEDGDGDDPPANGEEDQIARAVRGVFKNEEMQRMMQQMATNAVQQETQRSTPNTPDIVAPNQRGDDDVRVTKQRDVDDKQGAYLQTARMINALRDGRADNLTDARAKLTKAGHFDHQLAQRGMDVSTRRDDPEGFARAGLNTLTFQDGGVFLPDIVISEVAMQKDLYGAVRRNATRVPLIPGVQRYPKLTTKGDFSHLGEGQSLTAVKEAFGSVELRPRKAGRLTPWTREMNDVAGAAIMPVLNRVIAERREKLIDVDALKGDGSSQYGGINGILGGNIADVGVKTLATGKTSFADADWKDWNNLRYSVDESAVARGGYVIHPLSTQYLDELEDAEGRPLALLAGFFGIDGDGNMTYRRRPIYTTEAMDGPSADGVSTPFAVYGDFSQMYFGEMDGIVIDTFNAGTIPDPDGGSDINLISQDYIALRVIVFIEIKVLFGNAFAYMRTAAS